MVKSWKRRIFRTQEGQEHYLPPKDDLNAPDLYIPLMAFITYILVAAFVLGTRNEYNTLLHIVISVFFFFFNVKHALLTTVTFLFLFLNIGLRQRSLENLQQMGWLQCALKC